MSVPTPQISVVIPTYRRPGLLKRAIESVLAQTFGDFEIVVSDNEQLQGETGELVRAFAAADRRVRPITNLDRPQDHCGNTMNALLNAVGTWIKPLHDDDVLRTDCLAMMLRATAFKPGVECVACQADSYVSGKLVRPYRRPARQPVLEYIGPEHVHLAMLLLDNVGSSLPSATMISRRLVHASPPYERVPGIEALPDACWNAKLYAANGVIVLNEPLVEWHQGHETDTSMQKLLEQDQAFVNFRQYVFSFIPEDVAKPEIGSVENFVRLQRALYRLKNFQFGTAAKHLRRGVDPAALAMLLRWGIGLDFLPYGAQRVTLAYELGAPDDDQEFGDKHRPRMPTVQRMAS